MMSRSGAPAGPSPWQGIHPAQPRETGEVGVSRLQLSLVLDREGREVRVRGEIPGRAQRFQQTERQPGVAIAGMDDRDLRPRQPGARVIAGYADGKGVRENGWVGHKTNEAEDHCPGETDDALAVHLLLPPRLR